MSHRIVASRAVRDTDLELLANLETIDPPPSSQAPPASDVVRTEPRDTIPDMSLDAAVDDTADWEPQLWPPRYLTIPPPPRVPSIQSYFEEE